MEITKDFSRFLTIPIEAAEPLYKDACNANSFEESLKPRGILLLQALISFIAVPCIVLSGIIEAAINAATDQDWRKSFKTMGTELKLHGLYCLPVSLLGAFGPAKFAQSASSDLADYLNIDLSEEEEETGPYQPGINISKPMFAFAPGIAD